MHTHAHFFFFAPVLYIYLLADPWHRCEIEDGSLMVLLHCLLIRAVYKPQKAVDVAAQQTLPLQHIYAHGKFIPGNMFFLSLFS